MTDRQRDKQTEKRQVKRKAEESVTYIIVVLQENCHKFRYVCFYCCVVLLIAADFNDQLSD